ncbi:Hypothetical protein D9617_39g039230 [Elsinoe fawcettii]|nr:Hypothetical protein D9617_39g039230 [Elsinoe fawcettii]
MELLAHISARTSNKDDDRYRAQARNYIVFETAKRRKLSQFDEDGAVVTDGSSAGPSQGLEIRDFAYIDDTQLAISALESQIITSSLRKAARDDRSTQDYSPSKIRARLALPEILSQNVAQTKPATESTEASTQKLDHSQLSETDLSLEIPRRKDDSTDHGTTRAATVQQEASLPSADAPQVPSTLNHGGDSSSWSDEAIVAELPSTYSISEETSKGSNGPHSHSPDRFKTPIRPRQMFDFLPRRPETSPQSISKRPYPEHTSRPPMRLSSRSPRMLPPIFPAGPQEPSHPDVLPELSLAPADDLSPKEIAPQATIPSHGPRSEETFVHADQASGKSTVSDLAPLTTFILPPPPPPSIMPEPSTFVTSNLQKMKDDVRLADRYAPKHVLRDIRPRERGYWRFEPMGPQWTVQLEQEFWDFMTRVIEGGNVGWGIWCARIPSTDDVDGVTQISDEPERLGQVRVFCWGEVVEHVYLLLYVASRSKVRKGNPVWCDASGEVVIRARDDDQTLRASLGKV